MKFGFPYLGLQVELFDAVLEVSSEDVDVFEGSIHKEKDVDNVGFFLEGTIFISFIKYVSI